jgi:hypothetical protein
VGDLALDMAAFGARLARMSASEVARYVQSTALGAAAGRAIDEAGMLACAVWITQHAGDRRVAIARDAARAEGLRVAELVLEEAAPLRTLAQRARRLT